VLNFTLHGRLLSTGIILVTLLLSALFLADGSTKLVAAALLPPQAVVPANSAGSRLERPPGSDAPDPKLILARNMFDPTTGPLWPPKPVAVPEAEAGSEEPGQEQLGDDHPPPCEGSLRMVAAVHSELLPEWSFATLTTGSDKPLLYRLGGKIEDKEIVSIYPKAVYLRQGNGRLCSLQMFFDKNAARPVPSRTPAPASAPIAAPPAVASAVPPVPGSITEAELDQNIKALSETKYTVPRSFVDKILRNQAQIMSAARIVPHEENGRMMGVKLYGIRRNSLLGKLGLQNGDMLRTINGFEMSSPDSALEAYARLRNANNLSVAIVRRGQPTTLDYEVQ
jgi:general secretion pathway protein C